MTRTLQTALVDGKLTYLCVPSETTISVELAANLGLPNKTVVVLRDDVRGADLFYDVRGLDGGALRLRRFLPNGKDDPFADVAVEQTLPLPVVAHSRVTEALGPYLSRLQSDMLSQRAVRQVCTERAERFTAYRAGTYRLRVRNDGSEPARVYIYTPNSDTPVITTVDPSSEYWLTLQLARDADVLVSSGDQEVRCNLSVVDLS